MFKPGSQKVSILIVMKACLTRSLPSFAGSCKCCMVGNIAIWQIMGNIKKKKKLGKSEVGPMIMSPSPAKKEY